MSSGEVEPDPEGRSPQTGLKYKDIALLAQMIELGADLTQPRHTVYYLYFPNQMLAEVAAAEARPAGWECDVEAPMPEFPDQWSVTCERADAVLLDDFVREADDFFQGIADRLGGDFDGWEAAI